jgi:hypothetical protein
MPNVHNLGVAAGRYSWMREKLLREMPALMDDEQCMLDTLEGATDLNEVIGEVVRSANHDLAMADAVKQIMDDNALRMKRLKERADAKKRAVLEVMEREGLNKAELPDLTVSLRQKPQTAIITGDVPGEFCEVKLQPKKALIKQALQDGSDLGFAHLSNGGVSLSVRTK